MKKPAIGWSKFTKGNGSDPKDWFSYKCGYCDNNVSGYVVAYAPKLKWLQCPTCGNGSVYDHDQKIVFPTSAFGPEINGLPDEVGLV